MKNNIERNKNTDIEKIKKLLTNLGFICNSYPSSQQLIYSKNNDTIVIKNNNR